MRALDLGDLRSRAVAIDRTRSVPAALSAVATTAHDGRLFHAGVPIDR
jgi:hypothetical protein